MTIHECNICYKKFKLKTDLDRHKNRKFKCKNINLDVNTTIMENNFSCTKSTKNMENTEIMAPIAPKSTNNNIDDILNHNKCTNCNKTFTRLSSYKRHIFFRCKNINVLPNKDPNNDVINLLTQIKEQQIQMKEDHKQEIKELKETIIDLQTKIKLEPITNNTTNTTNNINNNNNTINNNIILQFGADVEPNALTQEEIIQLLNQNLAYIVPKMAELYHFDINKPKYHNVYISDKKSKFAVVFNGKQYVSAFLDDTIDMIDNKMKSHLRLFMRKLKMNEDDTQKIPVNDIKRMSKQLEKLNDLEDTDDLQKRSNQYLKFVLFDNKEMVKDTRNKMDRTTKQIKNKINRSEQIAIDY